ncbi:MAG TPA: hypothetical protein VE954_29515 [Oligoflexus sp.]|uniref:hypothetical protein n=1 Tax=Oligoflexus sp. TaxID=1971216 RepID=UPI002D706676|nr:hypothetical protein [Oligoflexus sp.]HYX37263.1 hypothetical protein [Oligoflexus sp.]
MDLTIGSRFVRGDASETRTGRSSTTTLRVLGGQLVRLWLRLFFRGLNVSDPTSGFRVYSSSALDLLATVMPDEYPEPESIALIHIHGLSIGESKVIMSPRYGGKSSLTGMASQARFMLKVFLALLVLFLGGTPRGRLLETAEMAKKNRYQLQAKPMIKYY